jgi:hypothetical protein
MSQAVKRVIRLYQKPHYEQQKYGQQENLLHEGSG